MDFATRLAQLEQSPADPAFDSAEYALRAERLRRAMEAENLDMLLLSAPDAMCWVTGYTLRWYKAHGPSRWRPLGMVAVFRDDPRVLLIDGEEHAEVIRRTTDPAVDVRMLPRDRRDEMLRFLVEQIASVAPVRRIGFELFSHTPSPAVFRELEAALQRSGAEVVDATASIRGARRQKTPAEIACIERAARICDAGITHLAEHIEPGMTELQVWAELERGLTNAGGEPAALHEWAQRMEPRSARHSISGRKTIRKGDLVSVDPCGVYNRYHSNRTALLSLGAPPDEFVERVEQLAGAYPVLREYARAGARVSDVSAALRDYYESVGLWQGRGNTWVGGYELGLSFPPDWVGEWTFTVAEEHSDEVFLENSVTNFESHFDIALYDTLVYEPGGARTLSRLPYEIITVR